ncbi:MAG: hypothetical protein IKQ05_02455 [Prevotella sp.]|nr:hypothetical protein [Prevotella sp.]
MANIKNLQMWNDICADARISISKSMLGLKTTATYIPTQSVIDAHTVEYTPQDGDRIKRILESPVDELAKAIGDFRPQKVPNGNYLLEIARSRDGQFIVLLLQQFTLMNYEPVTKTLFFEGDEAKVISQLF